MKYINRPSVFLKSHTKGFVLLYSIYIFSIIISLSSFITNQVVNKIKLESNLVELERQKCEELLIYSYFMAHRQVESFGFKVNDRLYDYKVSEVEGYLKLDCMIHHDKTYHYVLYYDLEKEYVVKMAYE